MRSGQIVIKEEDTLYREQDEQRKRIRLTHCCPAQGSERSSVAGTEAEGRGLGRVGRAEKGAGIENAWGSPCPPGQMAVLPGQLTLPGTCPWFPFLHTPCS